MERSAKARSGADTSDKSHMIAGAIQAAERSSVARQKIAARRRDMILALHVKGLSAAIISKRLGVSERTVWRDLAELDDARIKVETIVEDCGLDAQDAWITLSKMHDADVADILEYEVCEHATDARCATCGDETRKWTGNYLPPHRWPAIWRQGLAGEIVIEDVSQRSDDGVQAGDSKAWDKTGKRIRIKRESLLKIVELAGRLKSVGAFPTPGEKLEEAMVKAVTYRWQTAADKEVIDITPAKVSDGD